MLLSPSSPSPPIDPIPQAAAHVPFRQTTASVWLDLIRGLAAVLVLLDHTHHLFFVELAQAAPASAHPHLLALLYGLTDAGPQAVVIFFVLSGYLVSGSVLRWVARGEWSWTRYLIHRMVRLWLVLLPALVLSALWDGLRVLWTSPEARLSLSAFATQAAAQGLTAKNFFGNLFFLQTLQTATFGSNRVLWSLAFEFWYYLLFPLGLLALSKHTRTPHRTLYVLAFILVAAFTGRSVLALFPIWLLGVALHWCRLRAWTPAARVLALALYSMLLLWLTLHAWVSHFFKPDYVLGLATFLLLWVLLSARAPLRTKAPFPRFSRWLASFSYSLYLVHYPLLAFLAALLLHGETHWFPNASHLFLGLACGALAILYAWFVALCTEFHNDKLRDTLERRFGLPPRPGVGQSPLLVEPLAAASKYHQPIGRIRPR